MTTTEAPTPTTSAMERTGSIGACATPSRVFKGTRMAGQMGGSQVTAMNLTVVSADPERQLVLVKGAVPGGRGSVVVLRNSVKSPSKAAGR
jgi:large subunit ribosomal protein L3